MTPDQRFTLWTNIFAALPTIVFTGAVAYWNWRRDQERIVVQKTPVYWANLEGVQDNTTLSRVGIVVKNLSLYCVRIAGLGFTMDGKTVIFLNRNEHQEEWPLELPSHARMIVYTNEREWRRIVDFGLREKVTDWKFVAAARTETGALFFSNRFGVKVRRPLRLSRDWLRKKLTHRRSNSVS
jgi:hypothetical protein